MWCRSGLRTLPAHHPGDHVGDERRSDAAVNDDETAGTAEEMRSLADRAQTEAAKAQVLAEVALDARARAIRLRRAAERVAGADASPDDEQPTPLSRRRLPTVAAVVCVGLLLAFVGASVQMTRVHQTANHQRQLAAEFAAAARQGVVRLTSLDANHPEQSVRRILEDSTGTFREEFARNAGEFTKTVAESKVIEQGTVQAAVVDLNTMTSESAVVLVASTSEVTNSAGGKESPRKFRLVVTMSRDGDQLKMAKVDPVI